MFICSPVRASHLLTDAGGGGLGRAEASDGGAPPRDHTPPLSLAVLNTVRSCFVLFSGERMLETPPFLVLFCEMAYSTVEF